MLERTMEAFDSLIPDNCVRVSLEFGERWFVADFPTDLLWGELDRFVAELRADGGRGREIGRPAGFDRMGALASERAREAARRRDTRAICLAGLWIVFHRPPDAQAARTFFVETVERDGRAWIGISADENASVDSVAFDIAPAHLAEPDTDLDAVEILPATGLVH
jgi:hypothetical protein